MTLSDATSPRRDQTGSGAPTPAVAPHRRREGLLRRGPRRVYSPDRRVVDSEDQKRSERVVDALEMARWRRRPAPRTVVHSDRGSPCGFNRSSQHLVVGGGAWVWVSGRSRFVSTGGRSPRRDGRRSPGGRIGSGSGRGSLTCLLYTSPSPRD